MIITIFIRADFAFPLVRSCRINRAFKCNLYKNYILAGKPQDYVQDCRHVSSGHGCVCSLTDKELKLIQEQRKFILHFADPCSSVGAGYSKTLKQLERLSL